MFSTADEPSENEQQICSMVTRLKAPFAAELTLITTMILTNAFLTESKNFCFLILQLQLLQTLSNGYVQ